MTGLVVALTIATVVLGALVVTALVMGMKFARKLAPREPHESRDIVTSVVPVAVTREDTDELAALRTAAEDATAAVEEARAAAAAARTEAAAAKAEASAARAEARRILDGARAEAESVIERGWSGVRVSHALAPVPKSKLRQVTGPIDERLRRVAERAGATIVDPTQWLCQDAACPAADADGRPLYKDDSHIRASVARSRLRALDEFIYLQ